MPLPALRNIDIYPVEIKGKTLIALRDPEGYVEEQATVSQTGFFVLTFLNGENDVHDVQQAFQKKFGGRQLLSEEIEKLVSHLDQNGFLKTDHFEAIRKQTDDAFRSASTRPAYLAGKSYPATPDELRKFLNAFFTSEKGPGHLPEKEKVDKNALNLLIVPHIDFYRGGACLRAWLHRIIQTPRTKNRLHIWRRPCRTSATFYTYEKRFRNTFRHVRN